MSSFHFGPDSCYVPSDPADLIAPYGLAVPDAANKILVIFILGSEEEAYLDYCIPRTPDGTTPAVIRQLSGADIDGKTVVVYAHCTNVMPLGHIRNLVPLTPERIKFPRRCSEILSVIEEFVQAGYVRTNIFMAGHSAGGWIALHLLAKDPTICAGAIAFSPAMAGRPGRDAWWEERRKETIAVLTAAKSIPSLVYAFEGDEWETPVTLSFLANIPDVSFHKVNHGAGQLFKNAPLFAHCGAFNKSFNGEQSRILKFMKARIAPKTSQGAEAPSTGGA